MWFNICFFMENVFNFIKKNKFWIVIYFFEIDIRYKKKKYNLRNVFEVIVWFFIFIRSYGFYLYGWIDYLFCFYEIFFNNKVVEKLFCLFYDCKFIINWLIGFVLVNFFMFLKYI